MNSRFGTMSRQGFCHIHGSFNGIACSMCNPTSKEQAHAMYVFASFVVAEFESPSIGNRTLTYIFAQCMESTPAQDYLRLYDGAIERNLARARLTQVIKNNVALWIDGKTVKEPF